MPVIMEISQWTKMEGVNIKDVLFNRQRLSADSRQSHRDATRPVPKVGSTSRAPPPPYPHCLQPSASSLLLMHADTSLSV